jgi:hypothetical protein
VDVQCALFRLQLQVLMSVEKTAGSVAALAAMQAQIEAAPARG